jgi:hypothetical protein
MGNTWYRYDLPPKSYDVEVREYCGKSTLVNEGATTDDDDETVEIEYHFREPCGAINAHTRMGDAGHVHGDIWFESKGEAKAYITLESDKLK